MSKVERVLLLGEVLGVTKTSDGDKEGELISPATFCLDGEDVVHAQTADGQKRCQEVEKHEADRADSGRVCLEAAKVIARLSGRDEERKL